MKRSMELVAGEIWELHTLQSSSNNVKMIRSRKMRWAEHVALMGEVRNAYTMLVRRPERKRRLGRPRHRWEGNIKLDLIDIEYKSVGWNHVAQDRVQWSALVNTVH
jgi:hypothetical protein